MTVGPSERGRRAATPAALAALGPVRQGFRILPDPLHGQPLLRAPVKPLHVRVLLDRSHESAQAGEPTQDYLAVRCDPRRLTFAVTDGVGSSFLGDVAAQILAAHLADWFASVTSLDEKALTGFLRDLSRDMADRVAAWPIPASVSPLVRAALDQQRAYGSEAMFVGGFVDLSGGRGAVAAVAWLGDSRLRVVRRDGRVEDHYGPTTDRWSSRTGPRGEVGCRVWPVAEVARIIGCTDGLLPELDATVRLSDDQLALRLRALARRPGNDDIALVDVGVAPRAMPSAQTGLALWRRLAEEPRGRHAQKTVARTALRRLVRAVAPVPPEEPVAAPVRAMAPVVTPVVELPPVPVSTVAPPSGVRFVGREVSWAPVAAADSYSVEVSTEPTFADPLLYGVKGTSFTLPPLPGRVFVRVRSIVDGTPGPWGAAHEPGEGP